MVNTWPDDTSSEFVAIFVGRYIRAAFQRCVYWDPLRPECHTWYMVSVAQWYSTFWLGRGKQRDAARVRGQPSHPTIPQWQLRLLDAPLLHVS